MVGRPRPLRTSAPKPLLPRKPSLLQYTAATTAVATASFHLRSRILFTEGASERAGGAAQGARSRSRA